MGYYIQTPKNQSKAQQLVDLYGAERIPRPRRFSEVPEDKALICVVVNPMFDAAALAYSEEEFKYFKEDDSGRPRSWLLMDREKAHELAGYRERRAS